MTKNKQLFLGLALLASSWLGAQSSSLAGDENFIPPVDSVVLPVDTFFRIVLENHPLAVQARLIQRRAEAERLKASGNFDPKLFSKVDQKYFDEKTYYQLQNSGLSVPAWFGLSAQAGYKLYDGLFLNQQNTVPGSGLWYADLSLTLGKGLFIDERRAMLKQARLLQEAAAFHVQGALNTVLQEALLSYWQWYRSYQTLVLFENALDLAEFRFQGVRAAALVGEEPFIDTLEAAIQVQDRRLRLQKARADYIQNRNALETFLWIEGQIPLELEERVFPAFAEPPLLFLPEDWLVQHPDLNSKRLKIDRLEIEQRLNRENLKPQLDLNYQFLNQPTRDDFFANYTPNNYEWGLSASFPLFLRKERAAIAKTEVKIRENTLDLDLKRVQLQNKVNALAQELQLSRRQLAQARELVNNYRRLLQAEVTKFNNGESSLFLVNSREVKYLDSVEKRIELEQKVQEVRAKLLATAGLLVERSNP